MNGTVPKVMKMIPQVRVAVTVVMKEIAEVAAGVGVGSRSGAEILEQSAL